MPEITRNFGSGTTLPKSYKLAKVRPYPSEIGVVFDGPQMQKRQGSCEASAWQVDNGWMFGLPFGTAYRRPSDTNINNPIGLRPNMDDWTPGGAWPPAADIRYREFNDKACNVLFADGHAASMRRGEIKKLNLKPYAP